MSAVMRVTAESEAMRWNLYVGDTLELEFRFANGMLLRLDDVGTVALIGMACEQYLEAMDE